MSADSRSGKVPNESIQSVRKLQGVHLVTATVLRSTTVSMRVLTLCGCFGLGDCTRRNQVLVGRSRDGSTHDRDRGVVEKVYQRCFQYVRVELRSLGCESHNDMLSKFSKRFVSERISKC